MSIGGAAFINRVIVQGNGLLTFGAPVDFLSNTTVSSAIFAQRAPQLTDYDRTLVSVGQSNTLDRQSRGFPFLQSARLETNSATGAIMATFFTCFQPTAPGVCPESNVQTLTLTPTEGGYLGQFGGGTSQFGDRGFVSGGIYTRTGNEFLLPEVFNNLVAGVPEPATWAMMTLGFGAAGFAMRRKKVSTRIRFA